MGRIPIGDRNIVGQQIRKERKRQRIKQKDIAAALQLKGIDVDHRVICKIEAQRRGVSDKELKAIAEVLKVPVDWLLS